MGKDERILEAIRRALVHARELPKEHPIREPALSFLAMLDRTFPGPPVVSRAMPVAIAGLVVGFLAIALNLSGGGNGNGGVAAEPPRDPVLRPPERGPATIEIPSDRPARIRIGAAAPPAVQSVTDSGQPAPVGDQPLGSPSVPASPPEPGSPPPSSEPPAQPPASPPPEASPAPKPQPPAEPPSPNPPSSQPPAPPASPPSPEPPTPPQARPPGRSQQVPPGLEDKGGLPPGAAEQGKCPPGHARRGSC